MRQVDIDSKSKKGDQKVIQDAKNLKLEGEEEQLL